MIRTSLLLLLAGVLLLTLSILMLSTCIPDGLDTIMMIMFYSSILLIIISLILSGVDALQYFGVI